MRLSLISSAIIAIILSFTWKISYGKPAPVIQWSGQYLGKTESAAYLSIKPQNFRKSSRGTNLLNDVVIHLQNHQNDKRFVISQRPYVQSQPNEIWILPAGRYQVTKVDFIDNNGVKRRWQRKNQTIHLRPQHLSFLGLWVVEPKGRKSLKIQFKPKRSAYKHPYNHQTFIAVVDGLTGKIQKMLGGKGVADGARSNFGSKSEARAVFTQKINVAMYYKIDLGRNNRYANQVVSTIQSQETSFRNCYLQFLETNHLQGQVSYRFVINKENGIMERVRHVGGTLKDSKLIDCLYYNLGLMQFPLSKKIKGKIIFLFKTQ